MINVPSQPRRRSSKGGAVHPDDRLGRRFFGTITGFLRLILLTSLFFSLLVLGSYFAIAYFIRGEEVVAPDIVTRPVVEALTILEKDKLSLELERSEPSDVLEAGRIILQKPRPGSYIKTRTPIRVVVSSGSAKVRIPEDLIGMSRFQVGIRLRELGLKVGNLAFLDQPGEASDAVLSMDPPPGTGVPPETEVNLLVSRSQVIAAQATVLMPNVLGMSLPVARQILGAVNLTPDSIVEQSTRNGIKGLIHAQVPEAGIPITAETEIILILEPGG